MRFYTHAYASWEKISVEHFNRIIRRFYPKRTDFSKPTSKAVEILLKGDEGKVVFIGVLRNVHAHGEIGKCLSLISLRITRDFPLHSKLVSFIVGFK